MKRGPVTVNLISGLAAWMVLSAAASAAAISTPPPPAAAETTPSESLKMAQDPTSRLSLAVMINGQGPFDFLVDTGSERTVVSRELATKLALPPGPGVTVQNLLGADPAGTVVIDHLAIGGHTVDHITAPALTADNIGADGILGVDALGDLHLVMDFKTMRMSSSPSRADIFDGQTIVVRGRSRLGELVFTNAQIHGQAVIVVLDSGSQLSVGNPALLKLLTGHGASGDPPMTTQISSVSGRTQAVEVDVIPEAYLDGVIIRNMPLAFAPLHIFDRLGLTRKPALMLGMDVLSQCRRVSVDLRRREATFTLN